MKDLESMTQEELERAYRDARVTGDIGDGSRAQALEEELDRRDWLRGDGAERAEGGQ